MSDSALRQDRADQQIIIIGSDGMLGSRLTMEFEQHGRCVWGSTRNQTKVAGRRFYLDLSDDCHRFTPPFRGGGTAILCAAQTSILQCEREPLATRRINVENTVALAETLVSAGVFVIFLSSNTVFDGTRAFPSADDPPKPQHEYGRQKADAEAQVLAMGNHTAVIRFSKIIAPEMPLLAGWKSTLRAGTAIHPFSDAVMAPLSAAFAVTVIRRLEKFKRGGVIQASANCDISYEYAARYLAKRISADVSLVVPVSSTNSVFPGFPANTTLDAAELKQLGLEAPSPIHALDHCI